MPGASALQKATPAKLPGALYIPNELVKLRKWYAALANREASPAQILILGDSISEGTGSTIITRRWQTMLQRLLRARFDVNGYGALFPFIPGYPATTTLAGQPASHTGTMNTSAGFGLGLRTAVLPDATGALTYTFTGTRAKVMFARGATTAVARIVVDGGAAVTLDTSNASSAGGYVYDLGALTAGAHTVVITRDASSVTGRQLYVEGVLTYNGDEASGIRILDGAHHGYSTTNYIGSPGSTGSSLAGAGSAGLVILALGTNDAGGAAVAPATFAANYLTIVSNLRSKGYNGSLLYVAPYRGAGRTNDLWSPYIATLKDLAAADPDAAFLDLGTRMPNPTVTPADAANLGLYFDSLHPTDAGHAYIADVIAGFISPH